MKKTGKNVSQKPAAKRGKPKTAKPAREMKIAIAPGPGKRKPAPRIPSPKIQSTRSYGSDTSPIVGMGASAGGLEAFTSFFDNMPADSHMSFVLVLHLDPDHVSMMPELLKRHTRMDVIEAQNGMTVEPDCVYVIPPNKDMSIVGRVLQIGAPSETRGMRMPIDFFFRSLAEDQGEKAICVILSGTGSDGTLGMRAIHGAGGLCVAQEPETARYDGMPRSAIATGLADYVLPVQRMPEQLQAYVKQYYPKKPGKILYLDDSNLTAIQKILALLRARTGHDFSHYKKTTILRRIERRMSIHQLSDAGAYAHYMQENPKEVQVLFKELLIRVTSFFRDPEAFSALEKKILPDLIGKDPETYTIRVWVPGCGTGEEAYSIAILLREYMQGASADFKVQIFGTDIDEDSIAQARTGLYPANISQDVGSQRLKRNFVKEEKGFRIRSEIREWMVFAVQNVISDAPFTKLDLVSCRNLLIYLDVDLQNKLIPMFHYSLRPGGFLFLGSSETVGTFGDLFSTLDRKWKIFRRTEAATSHYAGVLTGFGVGAAGAARAAGGAVKEKRIPFPEIAKRVLLDQFAPPSVIVDERGDILYVQGQTGKFLEPSEGQPSMNVLNMAREGLNIQIRAALHRAATKDEDVAMRNLQVRTNGGVQPVDVTVRPIHMSDVEQKLFTVVFEEVDRAVKEPKTLKAATGRGQKARITELERELYYTRENLQASIEELQASNEELKSTNEEFQSTNEEFQSTNEELETSKEELQSVNEELITVNTELQSKIDQLTHAENDMKNILDSINTGIIFLDSDLRIKRFNAEATRVINLISTDAGRPLGHIASNLKYETLSGDAARVIDTLTPREVPVETKDGRPYLLRITPYRTTANVISGVVMTFTEITAVAGKAESAKRKG
ncbi:MAG TPA: chemotaxis protein CheB [Syntrophales bacterium]|nr:chemotaxis protein CheB [Syntrophales bacterium]